MKYQIGQVVKVREDLHTMEQDGVLTLWTDMCRLSGEEVVIINTKKTSWGDRYTVYGLPRSWSENCFVPAERTPLSEYTSREIAAEILRRSEAVHL